MKRIRYTIISLIFLAICTSHTTTSEHDEPADVLEIIYTIANKRGMKVISDLNMSGGDWYGKVSADSLIERTEKYISAYHERYGRHPSFWGWYLNNEINPIKVAETEKSVFWRKVWKSIVDECHRVRPGSVVTISPFFMLDKHGMRGFKEILYLPPSEYEEWWAATLKETGIDILMLQDSGEHLSFFTLAEREPFFAAFARACERAGTEFWVNVETGQADVKDWPEALALWKEWPRTEKWRVFTEMDWLSQKLELASMYGGHIINWGYYPLMNPTKEIMGPYLNHVGGSPIDYKDRREAYKSYKGYYKKVAAEVKPGHKTRPVMRGTLWYIPLNYAGMSKKKLKKVIEQQIAQQQAVGFDLLWLCNTPENMAHASGINMAYVSGIK